MFWRAMSLCVGVFVCIESGGCPESALAELPAENFDLPTLTAVTPPVLRAKPLVNWSAHVWGEQAIRLTQDEVLAIQRYLVVFSKDPAGATRVFRSRFRDLPSDLNYLGNVEDNVMSCYLLLWELGDKQGEQGRYLGFALEQLKALRNVEALLSGNGRMVFQIGLWASWESGERYADFISVVRASSWAAVEAEQIFPRPR